MFRHVAAILTAVFALVASGTSGSPSPKAIMTIDDQNAVIRQGKELFQTLSCSSCHETKGNNGCSDGPSLGGVGQRLSRQEILTAIKTPSASIASGFAECRITTTEGTSVSGYLDSESSASVVVRLGCSEKKVVERSQIDEYTTSNRSVMPDGLLDDVSEEEVNALLTFLLSL